MVLAVIVKSDSDMKNKAFDLSRLMKDIVLALESAFGGPYSVSNPLYLAVDVRGSSASISDRGKVDGLDYYPVLDLIYCSKAGGWRIDYDAVYKIVGSYLQLRA